MINIQLLYNNNMYMYFTFNNPFQYVTFYVTPKSNSQRQQSKRRDALTEQCRVNRINIYNEYIINTYIRALQYMGHVYIVVIYLGILFPYVLRKDRRRMGDLLYKYVS